MASPSPCSQSEHHLRRSLRCGGAGHYHQRNQQTRHTEERRKTSMVRHSAWNEARRKHSRNPLGVVRRDGGGQQDYTSGVTLGQTTSRLSRLSNFAKRSWKKSSFFPIGPFRCLLTRISAMPFRSEF